MTLLSPALAGSLFTTSATWEASNQLSAIDLTPKDLSTRGRPFYLAITILVFRSRDFLTDLPALI